MLVDVGGIYSVSFEVLDVVEREREREREDDSGGENKSAQDGVSL